MKPKVYALRMLTQTAVRTCIALITLGLPGLSVWAQVELAKDGPAPMSPQESLRSFDLRDGFAMTLIASEPLIQEPSGVCWDEAARLYVSELHGYNLEGQYDIEALNETGQLDRTVRRIQADEVAKKKALKGTYGVIKRLRDSNGDGTMDEAMVFADGLLPCFGMVAARGGIIVACAPHIMYLRDSDETKSPTCGNPFTGFEEQWSGVTTRNGARIIDLCRGEDANHYRSPSSWSCRSGTLGLSHSSRRQCHRAGRRKHFHFRAYLHGRRGPTDDQHRNPWLPGTAHFLALPHPQSGPFHSVLGAQCSCLSGNLPHLKTASMAIQAI